MTSDRVLIFGAAGHLGLPVARWISYHDPDTRLRLATRNSKNQTNLAQEFPNAEIISADYLDVDDMKAALDGVSAVFVVTPDFLDEKQAMENLVASARAAGDIRVIVRIQGVLPNVKPSDVPHDMRDVGGPATQHFVARSILNDSGLPVVHLNMVAYLTDDLLRWGNPIREHDLLSMPYNRRAAWVDPADVGEAAARIILSRDDRHIGHQYDVDNGHDVLEFDEVARMLSDVLQRQ
ncbi:NAD(P)H-binding protein, partial [Mycolicibacterium pulveris]